MNKISGILFDKDGTLFDFTAVWRVWIEQVIEELGNGDPKVVQELARVAGYNLRQGRFIPGSLVVNGAATETNQAWADMLPAYTVAGVEQVGLRYLENLPLKPVTDLPALFSQLRGAGATLGIATNDYQHAANNQLNQAGIAEYFDFICGFDSGYGAKPEAGMINAFCRKAGLSAQQVAMVGDSTHDLLAGKAAGAGLLVGVLTGPAEIAQLQEHADVVLPDISFLPEFLTTQALL